MTPEVSEAVRQVFTRALKLKDRLDAGERPAVSQEQAALRRLLDPGPEFAANPDYAGESSGSASAAPQFLGLRYALVCWLDELFIVHSAWDATWTEVKLEDALYGSNDRAWRFWEQAALAEERPDSTLVGVYLQCVALGFRGDYRNAPLRLSEWVDRAKDRACRPPAIGWLPPPHRPPQSGVPPLGGREKLRRMSLTAGWVMLLALPVIAYLAVRQLAR